MARIRPAGIIVSVVALVASATTATLGQADSSSPPVGEQVAVAVSGTSTLVGQADPGSSTQEGTVLRVRDNVLLTIERSSDPRVSGSATISVNFDAYPDPSGLLGATQVRWGRMRLQNDGGAWSGPFAGSLASGGFVQTYWLEGEGAYEGLSYVVTAGGNGNVWRSQGLIFPGPIPPLGGGASLPIEAPKIELPTAWPGDMATQPGAN